MGGARHWVPLGIAGSPLFLPTPPQAALSRLAGPGVGSLGVTAGATARHSMALGNAKVVTFIPQGCYENQTGQYM